MIEMLLATMILATLILAVSETLQSSFEMKDGLSQNARTNHRIRSAMNRVITDLQHAFIISTKDQIKFSVDRTTKGIFVIEDSSRGDILKLTTRSHKAMRAGSFEGDATYVVYELKESKTAPGRMDLYRGEFPHIPESIREEPEMRLLAKHIKDFQLEWWNGERFVKSRFSSDKSDTRNLLPRMIHVSISAWENDREESDVIDDVDRLDRAVDTMTTVVFIPEGMNYKEQKVGSNSVKWDRL